MTRRPVRSHDDAVGGAAMRAATGRGREEWFADLDAAGASAWDHRTIARWLVEERGMDGWWAQSVTVGYEQARGMRVPGQRPDGTRVTVHLHALDEHRTRLQVQHHRLPDPDAVARLKTHWTERLAALRDLTTD